MLTIKVTFPFAYPDISRQLPSTLPEHWPRFIINDPTCTTCDLWVIYGNVTTTETVSCKHTWLITGEPPSVHTYCPGFTQQFDTIFTCHTTFNHPNVIQTIQGLPWHIDKTHAEFAAIKTVPKTKTLSIISSNKAFTKGHRLRLAFAKQLKEELGDQVDLFGRGIQSFDDKWETLAPYKYAIVIENSSYPNYLTEKLHDAYLAHTYPIYHGCPNVHDYYNTDMLTQIDITEPEKAIQTIKTLIGKAGHYDTKLPHILLGKEKSLYDHNLFGIIAHQLSQTPLTKNPHPKAIHPENTFKTLPYRLKTKLQRYLHPRK